MGYQVRAYDNEKGDPVVVLVVTGSHDTSRFVQLFARGNCEQQRVREKKLRSLRRHNGGRGALALLKRHGGPDFTEVSGE